MAVTFGSIWHRLALAALRSKRPPPPPPPKTRPHFEIDLGLPAWKSRVKMDGVELNGVREVSVHARVDSLTEVKLSMYGTARIVGADGVEVDKIVFCPACQEKFGQ